MDNCDCNSDFTHDDTATEITVKPTTKQTVEIVIYEVRESLLYGHLKMLEECYMKIKVRNV